MMADSLLFLGVFAAWAGLHSLLMTPWAKTRAARFLGVNFAFYRLGFNLLAVLSFGLAAFLAPRLPLILWDLPWPWALPLRLVQAAGLLLFLWTFKYVDGGEFLGLGQVRARLRGGALPGESGERPGRLVTKGPYALCRHPMYLAGILILFARPAMSLEGLLFALFALAYFLLGSIPEERRLVRDFGDVYVRYRLRTPRIFPLSFPGKVIERGPSTGGGTSGGD